VIPNFIGAAIRGEPPTIYGDGLQSRDFTYVENAIDANLKACDAPAHAAGGVYNVACGSSSTLLDLIRLLERILGKAIHPVHEGPRAGDVRHSLASIDEARKDLGYRPGVELEEGLRRTLGWFEA
jgi:nucleoside-diphosphate-sugar epimerase